jgi:hypothetical protein
MDYGAQLYTLRQACAQRSSQLGERACIQRQMAEDCFVQVQALQEQLAYLSELDASAETTEGLFTRQMNLAQEGLTYQGLAEQTMELVDAYNRTIIELHVCIHKVRAMNATEARTKGQELLLAFEERLRELEATQQGLITAILPHLPKPSTIS